MSKCSKMCGNELCLWQQGSTYTTPPGSLTSAKLWASSMFIPTCSCDLLSSWGKAPTFVQCSNIGAPQKQTFQSRQSGQTCVIHQKVHNLSQWEWLVPTPNRRVIHPITVVVLMPSYINPV